MDGISAETAEDWWEVEALYDSAFGPSRSALSSYRLRDGVEPVSGLCFVARDGGGITGAVRNWPVRIGGAKALLLGPIAVHQTHQGEGIGAALMGRVLAEAPELGWNRVLLVGDAPYYERFGFARLPRVIMPPPTNPDRVLGWGDWDGVAGFAERTSD